MIKRQGTGARETFTVRKQSFGVGVERTFPLHSPKIEQIEVASRGDVRRAKLLLPARARGPWRARARAALDRRRRGAGLRRGRDAGRRRAAAGRGGARRGDGGGGGGCCRRRGGAPRARLPRTRRPPRTRRRRGRGAAPRRRGRRRGGRRRGARRRGGRRCRGRRRRGSRPRTRPPKSRPPTSRTSSRRAKCPRGFSRRKARQTKQKGAGGSLIELVTIVAVALGLALGIQAFLVKPFRIPSESMVPTLQIGQRVLVDRISKHFTDYNRGDILVFKPPAGADTTTLRRPALRDELACPTPTKERSDTNFIKRVVAVGGDRIKVLGGHVYLNGKRQKEPFARFSDSCDICNLPDEITRAQGLLLHDGRQPRGQRGQPRVGPDPEGLGDRPGLRDLLAARRRSARSKRAGRDFRRPATYHRRQVGTSPSADNEQSRTWHSPRAPAHACAGHQRGPPGRPSAPAQDAAAAACSPSTGSSAAATWPAPTRPVAARSPARWWPRRCSSTWSG